MVCRSETPPSLFALCGGSLPPAVRSCYPVIRVGLRQRLGRLGPGFGFLGGLGIEQVFQSHYCSPPGLKCALNIAAVVLYDADRLVDEFASARQFAIPHANPAAGRRPHPAMQHASGWPPLGMRWVEDRGGLRDGD